MRAKTYIGYMSVGALLIAGMPGSAWPQTSSTAPAASTPAASQDSTSYWMSEADRAEWQKEMERMRREIRAYTEQAREQLNEAHRSEWAQEARAMAEAGREKAKELRTSAETLRAELAKEIAGNRMINQAEADAVRSRIQAEATDLSARATEEAQQARQLFAQSPGLLDSMDDEGWLGVEISEVSADQAKELKLPEVRGVYVTDVVADSPAAKAGLEAKDVILEYDGTPVEGTVQFRRLVRETPPGRTVNLTVMHDEQEKKLTVQVGDSARNLESRLRVMVPPRPFNFKFTMPEFMPERTPTLGIEAEDLNGQLAEYFHVPGGEGVLIRDVHAETPAAKAGLKAGDVITKVDQTAVKSVGELREQLRDKREQKSVTLSIVRDGAEKSVSVGIETPPAPHRAVIRSAIL
jgi:serine protease Do